MSLRKLRAALEYELRRLEAAERDVQHRKEVAVEAAATAKACKAAVKEAEAAVKDIASRITQAQRDIHEAEQATQPPPPSTPLAQGSAAAFNAMVRIEEN